MKRLLQNCYLLGILFHSISGLHAEQLSCKVKAESAILINADTGVILFEKNAHKSCFPASVTKIATAAYILQLPNIDLDEMIEAQQEALGTVTEDAKRRINYASSIPAYRLVTDASHMGIKNGEKLSLRDLLYGIMVASADDASNVVAMHLSGSIPKFMDKVNAYLKTIGCNHTYFNNPHGLHHPDHKTTAYDMAIMTREAMKIPLFRNIVSTVRCPRPKTNKQGTTTLLQTNRLLRKGKYYYAKAIGVKTGRTSNAGYNLVSAAKDGDRTLIAVVLKCDERDDTLKDSIALFEAAFNQPRLRRALLRAGMQKFQLDLPEASEPVQVAIKNDIFLDYYPAEEPSIKSLIYWTLTTPPVKKDQVIGELHIQNQDGTIIQKVPLLAQKEINASWLASFKGMFSGSKTLMWIGVIFACLFLGASLLLLRRR